MLPPLLSPKPLVHLGHPSSSSCDYWCLTTHSCPLHWPTIFSYRVHAPNVRMACNQWPIGRDTQAPSACHTFAPDLLMELGWAEASFESSSSLPRLFPCLILLPSFLWFHLRGHPQWVTCIGIFLSATASGEWDISHSHPSHLTPESTRTVNRAHHAPIKNTSSHIIKVANTSS